MDIRCTLLTKFEIPSTKQKPDLAFTVVEINWISIKCLNFECWMLILYNMKSDRNVWSTQCSYLPPLGDNLLGGRFGAGPASLSSCHQSWWAGGQAPVVVVVVVVVSIVYTDHLLTLLPVLVVHIPLVTRVLLLLILHLLLQSSAPAPTPATSKLLLDQIISGRHSGAQEPGGDQTSPGAFLLPTWYPPLNGWVWK